MLRTVAATVAALTVAGGYPPPPTQGLRHSTGFSWMCVGGAPSDCPSGRAPRSLWRPLHLPRLAAGAECPVSSAHSVSRQFGIALGGGPAYPVGLGTSATLTIAHSPLIPGPWGGNKVLWVVAPSYRGALLIRGHQLDGPWWLGFEGGSRPLAEWEIPSFAQLGRTGRAWRDIPSYTRVRAPGCYAYQVDGTAFSYTVVFNAAA